MEVQLTAPTPIRRQIELLRSKEDLVHFRRVSIDLEMKLEDAKEEHKKLQHTIARRIEVIGKLHTDHADEKHQLLKEMDDLRAEMAQQEQKYDREVKKLCNLVHEEQAKHGRLMAAERTKSVEALAKAEERYSLLATELQDAQNVNDGFSKTIRSLEQQTQHLSVKLQEYQSLVLRVRKATVQERTKYVKLEQKFSLATEKHRMTLHYLVFALVVLWRFSRYFGERLATTIRSKNTLLAQWRTLMKQKVQTQRTAIRALSINHLLQSQLHTQNTARIEANQLANTWQMKYAASMEKRKKASLSFAICIKQTKGRFNDTTCRLLTGILFLWRLNLLLSQRLAVTGSILRAIEGAPEPANVISLARIEEVSEPSGSKSSIASLAEAGSSTSVTLESGGLGLSVDLSPKLTSEASIQATEEEILPAAASVKGEHLIFQSCGVDTADLEPPTVDAGVMTEPDAEELILRERIAYLNKKFNALETIDSLYFRLLVGPQQAAQPSAPGLASPASPTPNRLPLLPRVGMPIIPNGRKLNLESRIFSQPLERVPFPQRAFTRKDVPERRAPMAMVRPVPSSPQTPGTPTPTSAAAHRPAFLLNNTPGNLTFN